MEIKVQIGDVLRTESDGLRSPNERNNLERSRRGSEMVVFDLKEQVQLPRGCLEGVQL